MNHAVKTLEVQAQADDPAFLPKYGSEHAAGADVMACITEDLPTRRGAANSTWLPFWASSQILASI